MHWRICFVFVTVLLTVSATDLFKKDRKKYTGYNLVDVLPVTSEQLNALAQLDQNDQIYYYTEALRVGVTSSLMVSPGEKDKLFGYLDDNDIYYSITIHDVGSVYDEELSRLRKRYSESPAQAAFNITDWNTYEDIMTEIENMAARCSPSISCQVETIGLSDSGRDINVLRITKPDVGRQGVWVDSTIHAGEWLSPATTLMMFDHMTRNYESDPDVARLIDTYDWHYIPVMNPDGYVYSWEERRDWRKSTNINFNSSCIGTDLNRNYDVNWMHDGSSSDPCSRIYGGSAPASEPETQLIQTEIVRLAPTLKVLLTVHIAAQMWIHAWGHTNETGTCVLSDDHEELTRVVNIATDAVEDTFGTIWKRGPVCETIYPASGITSDYAYQVGITYSFTPELRGPGSNLTEADITPSFMETWNGVLALLEAIDV